MSRILLVWKEISKLCMAHSRNLQDLLAPSGDPGGHESTWLDENIAAYEVTDYSQDELLCPPSDSVGLDSGVSNDELAEPRGLESVPGTLANSELVLNLPQDAIRIVNDHADPEPPVPPSRADSGLPQDFLRGVVCLCGRGRSGQPSACHQVPAAHRNMRLYACRCPCYRAGLPCNDNCRCKGCRNPHGLNPHMFPPMMKRTKEQKACYCGYKQRAGQPEAKEGQRHCSEADRCMCVSKGRPCSTACRCRCCRNPRGRRQNEQLPPGSAPTSGEGSGDSAASGRSLCRCPDAEHLKKSGERKMRDQSYS